MKRKPATVFLLKSKTRRLLVGTVVVSARPVQIALGTRRLHHVTAHEAMVEDARLRKRLKTTDSPTVLRPHTPWPFGMYS